MSSGTLVQKAYDHIQESILLGRLPVGAVISEAGLAKTLGISRTPVGEAIRQLAREGLVQQVPRYGTIVRPIDRQEMIETYEVREALESYAAKRAAERADGASLARLRHYVEVMRAIETTLTDTHAVELDEAMLKQFLAADMAFHLAIIECAGNRRIMETVKQMRTLSRIFRLRRVKHDRDVVRRALAHHEKIFKAIESRDGELASQELSRHVREGMNESVAYVDREAARGAANFDLPSEMVRELDAIEQRMDAASDRRPV